MNTVCLPTNKRELKDWCLKRLGSDVIEINISPSQCEDRICEALNYYNIYHINAQVDDFIQQKVSASFLVSNAIINPNTFSRNETLTGLTSGATTIVWDTVQSSVRCFNTKGTFIAGEQVQGTTSTITLTTGQFFIVGDVDNQFIELPTDVVSVFDIIVPSARAGYSLTSPEYAIYRDYFFNKGYGYNLVSYDLFRRKLDLLKFETGSRKKTTFNYLDSTLRVYDNWGTSIKVDDILIMKVRKLLNTNELSKVFGDYFLMMYCYNLFKLQWGNNLKKYEQITLPGGGVISGQRIYDEAIQDLKELEEKAKKEFRKPSGFICLR